MEIYKMKQGINRRVKAGGDYYEPGDEIPKKFIHLIDAEDLEITKTRLEDIVVHTGGGWYNVKGFDVDPIKGKDEAIAKAERLLKEGE